MDQVKVLESFASPRPTSNPYIHQLAAALRAEPGLDLRTFSWREALRGDYEVFHLHWPDTLVTASSPVSRLGKRFAVALLLARLRFRGIPVVRTRHNSRPHEGSRLSMKLERRFARLTVASILLNDATTAGGIVIRHGDYRDWYAPYPRAERVADRIAFVGLIRPYKGVEELIAAFRELVTARPGASLTVSGKPRTTELARGIEGLSAGEPSIALTLDYVDDAAFVAAVTAASLVVLPYRTMENSGVALAALSLDRPILVPRSAATEALRDEVGPEWVLLYEGDLSAATLDTALDAAQRATGRPEFEGRDWADAGARHREVLASAARGRTRSR